MNNKELGAYGESLAKKYLTDNGYDILDTNVKFSRYCELDIIAKFNNIISFVEVKTRKNNNSGRPFEAITKTKYENIKKGVYFYLQEKNLKNYRYQIDVIGIILQPELKIEHLENI